jgi:hypothetical protein
MGELPREVGGLGHHGRIVVHVELAVDTFDDQISTRHIMKGDVNRHRHLEDDLAAPRSPLILGRPSRTASTFAKLYNSSRRGPRERPSLLNHMAETRSVARTSSQVISGLEGS